MGIFGSRPGKSEQKGSELTEKDKAILGLKRQKVKLVKYRESIRRVIAREVEVAKRLLKDGQKKRALLVLRKKRFQEKLIDETDQKLFNVEKLTESIEFSSIQNDLYKAMKQGNECLERLNSEVSVEDVELLMEESQEAMAYQQEVSAALSGQLNDSDEMDVEAELAAIEREEAAKLAAPLDLPSVPAKRQLVVPAEGKEGVSQTTAYQDPEGAKVVKKARAGGASRGGEKKRTLVNA